MSEGKPTGGYLVEPDISELVQRQANDVARQGGAKPVVVLTSQAVRRFQIETRVEGHRFMTDEPVKGGGSDIAPAPLRYFVAGVLQCIEIWTIKLAALEGLPMTALSATAEAFLEQGTVGVDNLRSAAAVDSGRGFKRLEVTLQLDSDWEQSHDDAVRALVRNAVRGCPAAVTFARAAELSVTPVHNGRSLGTVT